MRFEIRTERVKQIQTNIVVSARGEYPVSQHKHLLLLICVPLQQRSRFATECVLHSDDWSVG